ncbi:MAG TPA: ABC transporter permease [Acidimicrobiales bacterium]
MNGVTMAVGQVRWHNKAFWRNPASAFFTFAFPLMFLVIFTSIFNDTTTLPSGLTVNLSTYYTASILCFSVMTACYTNVAISVTFLREEGVLKRVRGTPLPGWSYLLGKVLHSMVLMVILVVIVGAFGRIFYDISLPTRSLPAFIITLLVGAASFSALGLACCALTPNADAAPAVTNATLLPLLFISGVFVPVVNSPRWMQIVSGVFPVKHFLNAILESFIPPPGNQTGWRLGDLAIVLVWGVVGLAFATRTFRWEPER